MIDFGVIGKITDSVLTGYGAIRFARKFIAERVRTELLSRANAIFQHRPWHNVL